MLRLSLHLDGERGNHYRNALRRVCGVELIDDHDRAQAVITDQVTTAQCAPSALWIPSEEPCEGDRIMPAVEWRFRPSLQVIAERLSAGKLGDPGLLRIHRWSSSADLLADADIACWLFSAKPETIYTVERPGYLQTHLGFTAGGMALIDHVSDLGSCQDYESLCFIGSDGAAYADDHHNTNLFYSPQGCQGLRTTDAGTGIVAMLVAFVSAVREESVYPVTLADLSLAAATKRRVLESAAMRAVS